MYCFRSLLFLIAGCLIAMCLGDHRRNRHRCLASVRWNEILKEIEKLNPEGFPLHCKHNKDLCVPEKMLKEVMHDKTAIVQVIQEIAELFNTTNGHFLRANIFLNEMYVAHGQLKTCLHSSLFNEPKVENCFKKMKNYLIQPDSHCAWKEVHAQSREILQRIELYAVKRKGSH